MRSCPNWLKSKGASATFRSCTYSVYGQNVKAENNGSSLPTRRRRLLTSGEVGMRLIHEEDI